MGRRRDESRRALRPPAVGAAPRGRAAELAVVNAAARSTPAGRCRPGVVVLEASAGTGKTYTIATLTARYVAAGTPLEQLLLVTFGRAATSELRDRVRARLVSAEAGLAGVLAGVPPPPDDELLALLAAGAGTRGAASAATTSPGRSPTSTGRRSRRPTGSADACSTASGWPATSTRTSPSSRTSPTSSTTSSTTCTCASSPTATRSFTLAVARRDRPRGRRPAGRRHRAGGRARRDSVAGLRQRLAVAVRAEVDRRKRRLRRADVRRPADAPRSPRCAIPSAAPRPAPGCGSATRS